MANARATASSSTSSRLSARSVSPDPPQTSRQGEEKGENKAELACGADKSKDDDHSALASGSSKALVTDRGSKEGGKDVSDETDSSTSESSEDDSSDEESIEVETDSENEVIEIPSSPKKPKSGLSAAPEGGRRAKKRRFILRRSARPRKGKDTKRTTTTGNDYADRFDYEKKYPEDDTWWEMEPNSRIWRVYLDEAGEYDNDMIENYKDTIDVILVFAGLFSAVVTTLAVQASTFLQLDYAQVMASILLEQIAIQRAIANGQAAPEPSPTTLNLDSSTSSSSDRWVNGLWFTSLAFSLSTALIGVLVKQWIQAYSAPVSGTPRAQARLRQYRFTGLHKWHVPLIIGLLPTLLHLSLLLFLLGLVVFLFDLDHAVASVVAGITLLSYAIYLLTNLLPIFDPQCPYKTPLSTHAYTVLLPLLSPVRERLSKATHVAASMGRGIVGYYRYTALARGVSTTLDGLQSLAAGIRALLVVGPTSSADPPVSPDQWLKTISNHDSLRGAELHNIEDAADEVDAEMLCWLTQTSSNPSVGRIVIQTLGSIPIGYRAKNVLREGGVVAFICSAYRSSFDEDGKLLARYNRNYQWNQCIWAHCRIGLTLDSEGVPTLDCPDKFSTDLNDCCHALYLRQRENDVLDEGDRWAGALICTPTPQSVESSYSHISRSWLAQVRAAALYFRSSGERSLQEDWPACYSLFQIIPLDTLAGKAQLLREVFVSIYLSSQFVHPLPNEPALLQSILLDDIPSDPTNQRSELWLISFGFCGSFLSGALRTFRNDPSRVKPEWWKELVDAYQKLASAAQKYSTLFDPEQCDFADWLAASLYMLFDPLVEFLTEDSGPRNVSDVSVIDLAICAVQLDSLYQELPGIPGDACPALMRLVVQGLERLKIDEGEAGIRGVNTVCSALCKLLDPSSRSRPEQITEVFRAMDVFSIMQRIFEEDATTGALLAECADMYIDLVSKHAAGGESIEERHDDDAEYIFKYLYSICVWYMSSEWDPAYGLVKFLKGRPSSTIWDDTLLELKTRELVVENEKIHGPIFLDHLERQLKNARAKHRDPFTLVAAATFASLSKDQPAKSVGRRFTSALQGICGGSQHEPRRASVDTHVSEDPGAKRKAQGSRDVEESV